MAEAAPNGGFVAPLRALLAALPIRRKRQLGWLTLLTLANAAADLLFVAAAMLFLAALSGSAESALPAVLRGWLGAASGHRLTGLAAIALGTGALAANATRLLYLWLSENYTAQVTHELTIEVQRRVFAQPYEYHVRHHSSEVIASLGKIQLLAFSLLHQWLEGVATLATGIAVIGLLASFKPLPAIAALAALSLLYLGIVRLSARRLEETSNRFNESYDKRIRTVQESLGAIRDLIIDHSERAQLDEFRQADAHFARAQAVTRTISAAPRYLVEAGAIILLAGIAATLASSGSALILVGGIALGGMRVLPLLQTAYRSWAMMAANRAIIADVLELLRLPVNAGGDAPPAPLPFERSVRIDQLRFSYPGRPDPILDGVTIEIQRGQRVAFAGATGSGKSTLADLIMGLLTPDAGTIRIDGTQLAPDNIRAWQRNIAHVSQSIFLADASIARNIGFSVPDQQPDMDRVRQAAAKAGIASFVESLPDGYETTVGERGTRLSGGQRQRLGIARALYKDTPLLVLDEATNALDQETEAKVLASLFADKDRTILIIAHRPSALRHCDQIIRLGDGGVVSD